VNRERHYIGGQWREPAAGRWRPVDDPSTGEIIAEVPDGDSADAGAAVEAARQAFDRGPWPRLIPEERRDHLLRLAANLAGKSAELTDLTCRDSGCPIRLAEILQVATPIGHLTDFAEQALLLRTTAHPVAHHPSFGQSEVRREPMGVCVGFTPYNFPLFMSVWKLGPAVAMGNTVVLKPSPLAPLETNALARACEEVGFPEGVINVVHGDVEVGEELVRHPDVDKVSFTGSTAVGRKIMAMASGTVKRLTLELGGKSASIMLDDADLELAVRGSLFGSLAHAGQGCVCTTRMLVPRSRYDDVIDLLRDRASVIQAGPADDFASDIGPLISEAQRDKVEAYVERGLAEGAKVLVGGRRPGGLPPGYYYEPTVLIDVAPDASVACDEIFGPVLSVIAYDDDEDAIAVANGTIYGLGGVVWTSDLKRGRDVAARIRAGSVWVNDFGIVNANGPFGGYKQSGFGREMSAEGALEYTELKHLYTALDTDIDARPYGLVGMNWD
jgi:acyl-CoA reductase-like NAD-dependent aldehyde dehydrogenase